MDTSAKSKLLLTVAIGVGLLACGPASAAIQFADIGKNLEYVQIDGAGTTVPAGTPAGNAFFYGRVFYDSGDYDGGSLTINTPNPTNLPFNSFAYDCCGSTGGQYQTPYISKADMDADFPVNTDYTLEVTDSTHTNPTTDINIVLPADLYDGTPIPTYAAASFNALNSLTAGEGLTVLTSTFTPDPNATGGQTFLSIFDLTDSDTVYSDFGSNTRDSWDVAPGIFEAGHDYEAQLIFDTLVESSDDGIPTTARDDLRTDLYFDVPTAGIPEPATWAMMMVGLGGIGALVRGHRDTAKKLAALSA